jgi:hypothetical protein
MTERWLYWIPRILSIIFAVFISLFALDVFGEGYPFWKTVLALAIHLIPTYLVIIAAVIAWKWELLGGSIFIGLGLVYILMAWNRVAQFALILISAPLMLVGGMFILHRILFPEVKNINNQKID